MRMALSARLAENNMTIVDGIALEEVKTRAFFAIARLFSLNKALIVVAEKDNKLALSARNIPGLTVQTVDNMNVYEILRHPQMMICSTAVDRLQERLK